MITLDSVRADRLGCYGYSPANTPAIDSLAARGVRFSNAFAQSPLTLPSQATIFTGLYPAEHTLLENGRHRLPEDITTLAEVFHQQGFATAAFVGGALLDSFYGLEQGFDLYNDTFNNPDFVPEDRLVRPASEVTDAALEWLAQADRRPFFCWINLADTRIADDLAVSPGPSVQQRYDQQLSLIDTQIARLINALKTSNDLDNTLIVVSGVQGEALGDHFERGHGLFLYSSTLQVPLIFSLPSRFAPGRTVTANVRLLDIFPTIQGFEGWIDSKRVMDTSQPELFPGPQSLLPALLGQDIASRASYARTEYPAQTFNWRSLRSLTADGLHYVAAPKPELYDLRSDPGQLSNLADSQPQRLADMHALMTELEKRLIVGTAVEPKLSPESLRILASLPEMPEQYRSTFTIAPETRPDPKNMIRAYQSYLAGAALLERKEYPQALEYLNNAANLSPASAYILSALATIYQRQERFEDSYLKLRLALALEPYDPVLLSQMVSLLTDIGQFPQAINYARLSLELKNLQPQTHNDVAVLLFAGKQTPIAIKALERALEIRPKFADAHLNLAVILASEGQQTQALAHFRGATEAKPDYTEAYYQWARLLAEQTRYSEAAEKLQKALELDPTRLEARYMLGRVFSLQNNFEQSIAQFRQALELVGSQDDSRSLRAVLYQDLGADLFKSGQISQAIDHLSRAIDLNPDLPDAHYWLAQGLASQGRTSQAIQHYQQALSLKSVFPEAETPLAQLTIEESERLAQAGQFAQAINLLSDVHKLLPRELKLANALARYLATCPDPKLRRGSMAVRLANQVVTATGGNRAEFLDTLAAAYAEDGDFHRAVETAARAYDVANRLGLSKLALEISGRIDLYKTARPYREPPE